MREEKNNLMNGIRVKRYLESLVIVAGFVAGVLILVHVGSAPALFHFKEGDVSLKAVYAPYDFTYPAGIDLERTENMKKEFAGKVSPLYDIDSLVEDKAFSEIDRLFAGLEAIKVRVGLSDKEKTQALKLETGSNLSERDLAAFLKLENPRRIQKVLKSSLENIFLVGIVNKTDKQSLRLTSGARVVIRNARFNVEKEIDAKDALDEEEAVKVVYDSLERSLPGEDRFAASPIFNLAKKYVVKNARLNETETNRRKEKARSAAQPIYKRETVKKNELIVEKGRRLTKDDIAKLSQIMQIHVGSNRAPYLVGLFALLLGLVFIASIYIMLFERRLVEMPIEMPKRTFLITINAFLLVLISLFVIQSHQSVYFIPLASIGIVFSLLLGANMAFILCLVLSLFIGFLAGGRLDLSFFLFIGSLVALYTVRGARRRSQILLAGFFVSMANVVSISAMGLLNNTPREMIFRDSLYGISNGILSSFIAIVLLPIFEYTFNMLTNITLLELSDLSHPILKELAMKTPGTYHHSIMVGNLAEEACNAIGANALLARVGAYYHDIGKIEKGEYFAENEMLTMSKHERLTPSMSALIITSHPKEGVELAKKYKLNNAVIDFISQHHGTGLVYYFYQRALEKAKSEESLGEEGFRYPGPKPQSKETAVVLLADSVEASTRMLDEPTPARIKGLVEKVINNKFIDGQLDECDLTLKDFHKIAASFARILMGVFHTRVGYPQVIPVRNRVSNGIKPKKEIKIGLKIKNK